ncbi:MULTISPECIES: hypothetical protein [Brevibacillus]|uniref:hypothetical protein n=1 Tax=Brevibacillus TaxID=55080 RepID=UPI000EE6CCE8|nr:hypothetical protein [Brevibacillus sp.]HBZ80252.1 hypothetical protein [Brevibacillus sp.]
MEIDQHQWCKLNSKVGSKFYVGKEVMRKYQLSPTAWAQLNREEWFKAYYTTIQLPNTEKGEEQAYFSEPIDELFSRFKSLRKISQEISVERDHLSRLLKNGQLEADSVTFNNGKGRYYDIEQISERVTRALSAEANIQKNKKRCITVDYSENLPDDIKSMISSYLTHRLSKTPGITIGGVKVNGQGITSEDAAENHRKRLERICFRIIANRCGINDLATKEQRFGARKLSEEEWQLYDPSIFSLMDFCFDDLLAMGEGIAHSTFVTGYVNIIRPFFQYALMVEEREIKQKFVKGEMSFEEKLVEMDKLADRRSIILEPLNAVSQLKRRIGSVRSVFLTRKEYVLGYNYVFAHHGIKAALIWVFTHKLGLRRSEATKVAVEDFWINSEGFLAKDDATGWGKLFLPDQKSKGGVSGSPVRGTPVPPKIVNLINLYLKNHLFAITPYEKHKEFAGKTFIKKGEPKVYARGHGFFFRPDEKNPDSHYAPDTIGNYLREWRAEMAFLDEEKRQFLSAHDGRHTVNEWINTARVDEYLKDQRTFAARYLLRHSMAPNGDINTAHYRDLAKVQMYLKIFDQSLNFPYDLDELEKWEEDRGYQESSCDEGLKRNLVSDTAARLKELKGGLEEIELWFENHQLQAPEGMHIREWFKKRNELEKEAIKLREKIKKGGEVL